MPVRRPGAGTSLGNHEARLRALEIKLGLQPNLLCDDIDGAFQWPWGGGGTYTTTFTGGGVALHQSAFAADSVYQPEAAWSPPVIRNEWAEMRFLLSVDTIAGYSASSTTLGTIVGEAVSGSSQANAVVICNAAHVAGTLTFRAGTILQQDPGPGSFANNVTASALAVAAGTVYDVQIRGRVSPKLINSQLIVDDVLLLDLFIANPAVGGGGLHETGCSFPAFGVASLGTGTPPTWLFDEFRYAVKSTDRRACDEYESPYD